MLETEFTKGNWTIEESDSMLESKIYSDVQSEKLIQIRVCHVKSFGSNFTDAPLEERRANEKLISAAPDMFNALRDLYDDKEVWSDLFESQQEFICRVLNKATGSSFFQH
jgi:hypothetical protein